MFRFLVFALGIGLFWGCAPTTPSPLTHTVLRECEVYSLKSAKCLDDNALQKLLAPYPVIFIGDHHTQEHWHQKVAQILRELSENGYKVKLANEWFYPQDNILLERYVNDEDNESVFLEKIQWDERLKFYPFSSFKPMYSAVKKHQGKLYGINLTPQERKKISDANLSGMSAQEQAFYTSLDLNVTPHQQLISPFLNHCHAPKANESKEECAQRMYRVQVAWDSKMGLESFHLAEQLQANEKLVVFAGSMHMESALGIPLRFSRLTPTPFLTLIPLTDSQTTVEHGSADIVIRYTPSEPKIK